MAVFILATLAFVGGATRAQGDARTEPAAKPAIAKAAVSTKHRNLKNLKRNARGARRLEI